LIAEAALKFKLRLIFQILNTFYFVLERAAPVRKGW